MLGVPEFDRDPEGRHREHAAPLYSGSRGGARHLSQSLAPRKTRRDRPGPGEPRILAIDTAGLACSAAVAIGEHILAIKSTEMVHGHAEALLPLIDEVVRAARQRPAELDAVAVTIGPGSFTGIRVGLAAAQGIALAAGALLFGVTRFAAFADIAAPAMDGRRALLVALESRRAELFVQLFGPGGQPLCEPGAVLPPDLSAFLAPRVIAPPLPPVAGVLRMALRQWRRGDAPAAPRPLYLRPPDVTVAGRRTTAGGR